MATKNKKNFIGEAKDSSCKLGKAMAAAGATAMFTLQMSLDTIASELSEYNALIDNVQYGAMALVGAAAGCAIGKLIQRKNKLEDELFDAKYKDKLTGLYNKSGIVEALHNDSNKDRRNPSHGTYSVIFLDLDNFKRANDLYGMERMDQDVLIPVAEVIKDCLRDDNRSARLGGDEYEVILPNTPYEGAQVVRERIVAKVNDMLAAKEQEYEHGLGISISAGVASADITKDTNAFKGFMNNVRKEAETYCKFEKADKTDDFTGSRKAHLQIIKQKNH